MILETLLGTAFALTINQKFFGRSLLQSTLLIPWAIPAIVSAKMWAWMFNDLYGIINEILIRIGILHTRIAWLANPKLTLLTLVIVDVWKTTPFMTLLILAGLQNIPKTVIEASILDGVPALPRFFSITLPFIQPALFVAIIFRTLDALRVFDLPYVLTSNSRETAVISIYVRNQLVDFQEIGYGSAASFIMFCIIGLFAILYIQVGRKSLRLDR